jgi:hypothetical protein
MSANGDIVGTLLRRAFRGLGGVYIQPIYNRNILEESKWGMANLYATYICLGGRHPHFEVIQKCWSYHEKRRTYPSNRIYVNLNAMPCVPT